MDRMVMRAVTADELDEACEFYWSLADRMQGAEHSPAWTREIYPSRDDLSALIAEGALYLGRVDGELMAGVAINQKFVDSYNNVSWNSGLPMSDAAVVHVLCVDPAYQGQGLAKQLVAFSCVKARSLGARVLRLDVYQGNLPAERLYESCGFDSCGKQQIYYEDTGLAEFTLYERMLDGNDLPAVCPLEVLRATDFWAQAGAAYVRVQAMARKHHIPLQSEFDKHDGPDARYVVLLYEDFPVATARVYPLDANSVMIGRVVVLPEFRRRGIGSVAVREAERWAKDQSFCRAVLEARDNKLPFYEALGYMATGEPSEGPTFTTIPMEKALASL